MKRRIERVATILTLICAIFVIINLVRLNAKIGATSRRVPLVQPEIVGKEISVLKDSAGKIKKTLVLFINPGCRFCEESFEFYRNLASLAADRKDIQIVAVTNLPAEMGSAYLRTTKLGIEKALGRSQVSLPLRGIPTLVMLNERGVVVRFWIGKLSSAEESEVIRAFVEN